MIKGMGKTMVEKLTYVTVDAVGLPHMVATPRSVFATGEEGSRSVVNMGPVSWGVVIGNPLETAMLIRGSRDDVLDYVERVREELLSFFLAEHENGLHNGDNAEYKCPWCRRDALEVLAEDLERDAAQIPEQD